MAEASVLLRDSNLDAEAWLENAMQIGYSHRMNEVYTAHFSLPSGDPKVSYLTPRTFVEIYEGDTSRGVYRIVEVEKRRIVDEVLFFCRCEHVIATLMDDTFVDEHKIEQTGSADTTETAIEYILDAQSTSRWQFGSEEFERNFWYLWDGVTLLKALFDVPKRFGEDYVWTYSTSSYPWTVSLLEPTTTPTLRLEYGRNMTGIRKREDASMLFNRLYAYGYGEGENQINITSVTGSAEYVEDATSQSEYGLVVREWTDQRFTVPQNLYTAAMHKLTNYKNPLVFYEIDAADLSQLSGSQVASIEVGDLVHVYDTEVGVDANVRVVEVTKRDINGAPGDVYIQLSNKLNEFYLEEDFQLPSIPDTVGVVGNLIPNYSFEEIWNSQPRYWTLDGWSQTTAEEYHGIRSLSGSGSSKTAYCDKQALAETTRQLLVKGRSKTDGVGITLSELSNTTITPESAATASGEGYVAIHTLTSSHDSIELWDVSDGSAPFKDKEIDESGSTQHCSPPYAIYGDYLVCGDQDGGHLYVFDISDTPTQIADYSLDESTAVLAVVKVKNWVVYALCDDDTNGPFIETIDLSNPASPTQLGTLSFVEADYDILDADFSGDNLYVSTRLPSSVYTRWTSPSSASGSDWSDLSDSVDDDTGTYAVAAGVPSGGSRSIEFTLPSSMNPREWRMMIQADATDEFEVFYYDTDLTQWVSVLDTTWDNATMNGQWQSDTLDGTKTISKFKIDFTRNAAGAGSFRVYELQVREVSPIVEIDVSNTSSMSKTEHWVEGHHHVVTHGTTGYFTCKSGTDDGKIVVADLSSGWSRTRAIENNSDGEYGLCMIETYLANAGDGDNANQYAITYWDLGTPSNPSVEDDATTISGAINSLVPVGTFLAGVDTTNNKLRIITAGGADWTAAIRFYNSANELLDTLVVYDGDKDQPVTRDEWVEWSYTIPSADRPLAASQIDMLLTTNSGASTVYVDALEARFKD